MTPGPLFEGIATGIAATGRTVSGALVLALTLLLAGCIGGGLHSNQPPQQLYLLGLPPETSSNAPAVAASVAASAADQTLEVLSPAAAPGLGGEGIAVLRAGGRLDYYSGARWASSAPTMLQTLAIEALRRQGHFALVQSDSGPFETRWVLSLELTHFEADYSGGVPPTIRVALVCTLGQRTPRAAVTTLTVSSAVSAQADRMQAVLAAFQRATDAALARMAAQLAPVAVPAAQAAPAGATP